MDKLGKLGTSVSKKLQGKKQSSGNNSGGLSLQELIKEATAKALRRPDPEINQQVIDIIGSAVHTDGPKEVARLLTERLTLKNPHKVWLAIELIKEVLKKCESEIAPVRDEIMMEVGKVASGAMNRFNSNLADQQRAKSAAFDLLKTYGQDGHILSQPHLEYDKRMGAEASPRTPRQGQADRSAPRQYQSWAEINEAVETQIAIASSHNDLLQDMLLDTSSFESRTPEQRRLAKDVILEATQFRQLFEALLAQLSTFDTPDSNNLMTAALEKMDILNNSLNLHKEQLKKQLQDQHRGPSGTGGSAAPRPPSNQASPKASTPRFQPPAMGGLMELQQGFDAAHQQPQPAAADPFAASSQWRQEHPASQGWHSQRPPPQHFHPQPPQQSQAQASNPFNGSSGPPGWHGHGYQQMPMPGGYPGYGYGGYAPGYGYGPPPSYSQGFDPHHQQQQWHAHPPVSHGYGQYPPSYQPHPQHMYNPGYAEPPQQQGGPPPASAGHEPARLSEATTLSSPGSGRLPDPRPAASHRKQEEIPASNEHEGKPTSSLRATGPASPAAPGTPAATHSPVAGGSPSPVRLAEADPGKAAGFSAPNPADVPREHTAAPDSASSPFLAGFPQPDKSGQPPQVSAADDWDLFFTERVGDKQPVKQADVDKATEALAKLSAAGHPEK